MRKMLMWVVVVLIVAFALYGYLTRSAKTTQVSDDKVSALGEAQETPQETMQAPIPVSDIEPENKGNPIDAFRYDLVGNTVGLKSYIGSATRLEIESAYTIDGREYATDLSDFQVGVGNRTVKTLILDEGITEVNTSIFNSSSVESVYFPASMELVYDYTLSYIHPNKGEKAKIYYAGTQEQWQQIFTEYHRKAVGDTEFGDEMGQAVADAINQWIGATYDKSMFEFYFSATPEMVN